MTKPASRRGTAIRNTPVMASANANAMPVRASAGRWAISSGVKPVGAVPPSRSVSRLENRAPNNATPSEPPTARKNVTVDVATPRSARGASFWVASTMICIVKPMPTPRMAMYSADSHRGESVPSVDSRYMPMLAMAMPTIGNIR